jgi:hypothetical protein
MMLFEYTGSRVAWLIYLYIKLEKYCGNMEIREDCVSILGRAERCNVELIGEKGQAGGNGFPCGNLLSDGNSVH